VFAILDFGGNKVEEEANVGNVKDVKNVRIKRNKWSAK
jgi:hypothetical protein